MANPTQYLGHVLRKKGKNDCFYSIGVDSRGTKSERETKDHLEKNCWENEKQGRVEELECSQGSGAEQRELVWKCVGLMRLLARRDIMMIWLNALLFPPSFKSVVTGMDTPKYGETLEFVYIKYQPILVKFYQRFTNFNYGVTRTIYES